MKKNLFPIIIILLVFLLFQSIFAPKQVNESALSTGDIAISSEANSYAEGKEVKIVIKNNLDNKISVPINCPGVPLEIYKFYNNTWTKIEVKYKNPTQNCTKTAIDIEPTQKTTISLKNWTYQLFGQLGRYQVKAKIQNGTETKEITSNEFTVGNRSFLGSIWFNFLYRPIFNFLILLIKIIPGNDLGFAIIALTILIRIILYFPSQKALKSQKKLQAVQPKLQEIQKIHKGNQERIATETMKLWKEHKVNPFGSCLPLLIQMPVLIALFYVIQEGIIPDNTALLYGSLKNIDFASINVVFLGILNLSQKNTLVLPVLIGALQFIQMKMTMPKKKQEPKTGEKEKPNEMEMANNIMIYFMPVMIAVFTAGLPSGVGLYWGVSTTFGIFQQMIVNKEKSKNEPVVKVISASK